MRLFLCVLSVAVLLILTVGCENEIGGFRKNELTLSFATFNTRMGSDLPHLERRKEKLLNLINEMDADVVCLQEVYDQKFNKELIKTLDKENRDDGYFSFLFEVTKNDGSGGEKIPPACSGSDLAPLLMCVAFECGGLDPVCLIQNCLGEILEIPAQCQGCLLGEGIGSILGGDFEAVLQNCMMEKVIDPPVYSYSGNNGILLASKYPLKDKKAVELTSSGVKRMAIVATIGRMTIKREDGTEQIIEYKPGIGDVQVICTGLSKVIDEEYDGVAGSWQGEQMLQIEEILAIPVKDDVRQRVIMGSFDSNLNGGVNIVENNPIPVQMMVSNGWYDPYFDVHRDDEIECTVCPENPFVNETEGFVPDHIFFLEKKGFNFSTQRLLVNEYIFLDYEAKEKVRYSVSDHYAISATMTVEK